MKVADLKKELNNFKDDDRVYISLKGAEYCFELDIVDSTGNKKPVLGSSDAVEFSDLYGMGNKCFEENGKYLKPEEKELLVDFLVGAEQMERKAI